MNKYNSKSVKCKKTGRKITYFVDKTYFLLIRYNKKMANQAETSFSRLFQRKIESASI